MQENSDYTYSTSFGEGILEIVLSGKLTLQSLNALRSEMMTILQDRGARAVLADCREVTGPHEIVDAYYRTRSLPFDVRQIPVAIVDRATDISYQSFFEATAANVGMTIKWFTDVESARSWLQSKVGQ